MLPVIAEIIGITEFHPDLQPIVDAGPLGVPFLPAAEFTRRKIRIRLHYRIRLELKGIQVIILPTKSGLQYFVKFVERDSRRYDEPAPNNRLDLQELHLHLIRHDFHLHAPPHHTY